MRYIASKQIKSNQEGLFYQSTPFKITNLFDVPTEKNLKQKTLYGCLQRLVSLHGKVLAKIICDPSVEYRTNGKKKFVVTTTAQKSCSVRRGVR